MQKVLKKWSKYFLLFLILLQSSEIISQNVFSGEPVQVVGPFNGYSTSPYETDYRTSSYRRVSVDTGNPNDGRGQWVTTINAQPSGGDIVPINMAGGNGNGFLFISGPSTNRFQNKWVFSGVGAGTIGAINNITAYNSGNDMGLNMSASGRYTFVFNDAGYTQTNARYYVGFTANNPVSVTRTGQTYSPLTEPVIQITTGSAPSAGENIYVRYRVGVNDFSTGTLVVQATGSGTSWTATLPIQSCGTTLYYYVYSSTRSLAQINTDSESDRSLAVLKYDDNAGQNYAATLPSSLTYYQDADNDGFGNPSVTQLSCIGPPVGYVTNNTDCNDANNTVYPGAPEICYDGLDNNCNSIIDDGCTPILTMVQASQCGTTLPFISSNIFANLIGVAQGYRFRVTDMTNMQVQTIDKVLRVFAITQLGNYAFARTYKVEVALRINNVWQPFYGTPCFVSTPATTTQVQVGQCNTQLTSMGDVILADFVAFSTGYRFRITNLLTLATVIVDRPTRDIRLNAIPTLAVEYNTTYSVEVAIRNTDNTYLPYGTLCNVTTPNFPTSQIQITQCDGVIPSFNTLILADSYTGASQYRFRFVNSNIPYNYIFDKTVRSFTLSSVPGLLVNTTYTVQVALEINGVFGPFGKACTLTTPATTARFDNATLDFESNFEVTSYPNPFEKTFKLSVNSLSEERFNIKVYDLLGKQIENTLVEPSSISDLEIGTNYPSGIYNVILSQGNDVKTLRVIKR